MPSFRQGVFEKCIRAAVELGGGDDVITGAGDVENRAGDGGLAAGVGEGGDTTFECGDALFEHVGGGVHDTGVNVAELFEAEEFGRMVGIPKHVAGGLINRDGARACF